MNKTVLAFQPTLARKYRTHFPQDLDGGMCFAFLGTGRHAGLRSCAFMSTPLQLDSG